MKSFLFLILMAVVPLHAFASYEETMREADAYHNSEAYRQAQLEQQQQELVREQAEAARTQILMMRAYAVRYGHGLVSLDAASGEFSTRDGQDCKVERAFGDLWKFSCASHVTYESGIDYEHVEHLLGARASATKPSRARRSRR